MCILAHPDDESLGMGGTLAKYSSEGVDTYLVTATRGERGRFGEGKEHPGLETVGKLREAELLGAAKELGIREVRFLDYMDGDLDKANVKEVVQKIAGHLRRTKPQVVLTFDPNGGYGHPDHIAISQFAAAAIVASADSDFRIEDNEVQHRVSKFYYMGWTKAKWESYQSAFRDLKTTVDGVERRAQPWSDWAITTVIDTKKYWEIVWRAVCCHKTQMAIYSQLEHLPKEDHEAIWGSQEFYRVFSLVNSGREKETDLFEGLR
jgi:LmbE family N-acetylglucosaminyl deacetylase